MPFTCGNGGFDRREDRIAGDARSPNLVVETISPVYS
jgi:hypothetical protein